MPARLKTVFTLISSICAILLCSVPANSGGLTVFAMGAGPPVQKVSGSKPNPLRIRRDLKRLQKEARKLKVSGKDPIPVIIIMKQVPPLMKQKKVEEADRLIKEAFRTLESIKSGKWGAEKSKGVIASPPAGPYEKIKIIKGKVKTGGFGDPAMEYGPDGVGWLVYTSVDVKNSLMTTNLAKSVDNGKTWKFVKVINPALPDTVDRVKGNWVHETSTIVYDPGDKGREWKVFWFKYFRAKGPISKNKKHTWVNSWIAYKYASDPQGKWSEEIPVFGMGNFRDKGVDLASLNPDLKNFVFFYELGSLYKDGTLYLSLEGNATPSGRGKWNEKKIVLLSSGDHGRTWRYVGTLLDSKDAKHFGYLTFTASSLVREKGRIFLFASPSGRLSNLRDPEGHHDGIHIFEFEDITKGVLKRDKKGHLILVKHIDDNLEKGGQGDYDEQNTYGGIVIPQEDLKYYPELFQLFSTRERIVD